MRLFSWNVNGLRSVAGKGFRAWIDAELPDVLALQEVRAEPHQVDEALTTGLLADHGYHQVFNPAEKKGYSGTATFSRRAPDEVELGLGEARFDSEGRTVITRYGDVRLINCYFPNGQRDLGRIPYKLDFYRLVLARAQAFRAAGERVIICGDWNTAHQNIDLKNWKANQKMTGFRPEERALLDEFEAAGYIDAFRKLHPEQPDHYTWWSNRAGVRERNIGWRIDYHWVAAEVWPTVKAARLHPQVLGSDHCPIELQLTDPPLA